MSCLLPNNLQCVPSFFWVSVELLGLLNSSRARTHLTWCNSVFPLSSLSPGSLRPGLWVVREEDEDVHDGAETKGLGQRGWSQAGWDHSRPQQHVSHGAHWACSCTLTHLVSATTPRSNVVDVHCFCLPCIIFSFLVRAPLYTHTPPLLSGICSLHSLSVVLMGITNHVNHSSPCATGRPMTQARPNLPLPSLGSERTWELSVCHGSGQSEPLLGSLYTDVSWLSCGDVRMKLVFIKSWGKWKKPLGEEEHEANLQEKKRWEREWRRERGSDSSLEPLDPAMPEAGTTIYLLSCHEPSWDLLLQPVGVGVLSHATKIVPTNISKE